MGPGAVALLGGLLAGYAVPAALPEFVPRARVAQLAPGRFLVASCKVRGPIFSRSVVLLLEYSAEGALGLVINRPSDVPLLHLLPDQKALVGRGDTAWVGGPVGRSSLWILLRAAPPSGESSPVVDGVHATTSKETLRAVLEAGTPESGLRAYLGYAGWAPRQLDDEVTRGDWYIDRGAAEWIFERDAEEVWPALIERNAGLRVRAPRQRVPTTYAIQAGSSGAWLRRVKTPLPSSVLGSVPSQ
jgi:putative transcriptional regulator